MAIALTAIGLVAGFLLKDQCVGAVLTSPGYDGAQYRRSCYSDVFVLWSSRNFDREPIPYIHGGGDDGDEAGDLEYPQGTGVLVAIAALIAKDGVSFFVWSALLLGASGLISAVLLARLAADRRRIAYFAVAPTLVLYAFHNWDLGAVALMCAAMVAWSRRADRATGMFTGLGAATKIFPGLLLPVFALARRREDARAAARIVVAGIVGFAIVNVPFMLLNLEGWWEPWSFQSRRGPNYDSTWYVLGQHLPRGLGQGTGWARFTSVASTILLAAGAIALLRAETRRRIFRPYVVSCGLVLLFLLTGKVFSPQYALWVLPFFVLLNFPWYAFAIFTVAEAAVWFAIAGYLLSLQYEVGDAGFRYGVMEITVWLRFVALAWLLWMSRRAEELVLPSEEPQVSREQDHAER